MSRTIIVSNRLPITISSGEAGTYQIRPSSGGLASGLRGIHNANGGTWIGWAGDVVEESLFPSLKVDLLQLGCVPVPLSPGEVESYYDGLCNGVLWPLFHYQTERMPISGAGWDDYVRVNERFAAAVADAYEPGDNRGNRHQHA